MSDHCCANRFKYGVRSEVVHQIRNRVGPGAVEVSNRSRVHNLLGLHECTVTSTKDVPKGRTKLRYEFEPTGKPDIAKGRARQDARALDRVKALAPEHLEWHTTHSFQASGKRLGTRPRWEQ